MVTIQAARTPLKRIASLTALCFVMSVAGANAQSADDSRVANYKSVLQQIANKKLEIDHKQVVVATQAETMKSLRSQIKQVNETKKTINPMMAKMATAIEDVMNTDMPFQEGERFNRLDGVKETMADATATPADKMRKLLNIYSIEVGYGQSLEAYDGDSPVQANAGKRRQACREDAGSAACAMDEALKDRLEDAQDIDPDATLGDIAEGIMDGTYIRYGRMALAYMSADGSESLRFDGAERQWVELPAARALEVRRAIRIARGESAPGVVTAPVLVAN